MSLKTTAKRIARPPVRAARMLARKVRAQIPRSPGRMTGKLAIHGGEPVRNTHYHPWPVAGSSSFWSYFRNLHPAFCDIFTSGKEGLPGDLAAKFNKSWAEYCHTRHALLLPHGTDALRFGLAAAVDHDGLEYGGEVIVPNLTFIATANAALDRRFGVALVDVDPTTLNIDPQRVAEAIIPGKTRAIMAVHLFGQPADMKSLREIAQKHSLTLIEDAAQAHGAQHQLGRVGTIGDVAAFSFQSSKNLSSGEGGALTTNSDEILQRAYGMQNAGRSMVLAQRWSHETVGLNCRPTEYVAAVLLHRLANLEAEQQTRWTRFLLLRELLSETDCVQPLALGSGVLRHGVHMFVMRYRPERCGGLELKDFIEAIQAEGLPLYRGYEMTLAQQPAFQRLREKHPDYLRVLPTPVADSAVHQLVFLPHSLFLGSDNDITEIAAIFRKVQAHYTPNSAQINKTAHSEAVTERLPEKVSTNGSSTPHRHVLRVGIVGIGIMGRYHAAAILRHRDYKLIGVTDANTGAAQKAAEELGCKCYPSPDQMIKSGDIDTLVIATPHWHHADLAVAALKAGLNVIAEKPLTVTVEQSDNVLEAAEHATGLLAVVHQNRFEPAYQYAKKLLDAGDLGPIYRCSMTESAWRTEAYYRSSPWRGTWKGEGGGVLLNQAPHFLDRYIWLCGMPESVFAHCDTTLHQIEVEDTVSALVRHPNGAHGQIHVSTVECPPISQLMISCDGGRILIDRGSVRVTKLRGSIREETSQRLDLAPELENETTTLQTELLSEPAALLPLFYDNFFAAHSKKRPLMSSGLDGRNVVELANALILSSAKEQTVTLPIDRAEYAALMAQKLQTPIAATINS